MAKIDIKNLGPDELLAFLAGRGKERFRTQQLLKWLYQKRVGSFAEMTNLSKDFRRELEETAVISTLVPEEVEVAADGTRKFLFRLEDGEMVESVLIPDEGRNTLCISSQVGCAMACSFCLTGTFSLARNLTTAEIVNQVIVVQREFEVRNLVFMGMGEPLANLDNVIPALRLLTSPEAFQFSNRRVTVSTAGLVPAMERLGREVTVNLAISLNATTDAQRDVLMPVNRTYPLRVLLEACRNYPLPGRRMLTIEYVLIRDVNDSLEDAKRLVRHISDIPCKVNLIPFNVHEGCDLKAPTQEAIDRMHSYLLGKHFTVITRSSRGDEISAACGQLKGRLEKRRAHQSAGEASLQES